MTKRLILLRGLPGAGKTTLAKFLAESLPQAACYSADDYFVNPVSGEYEFDREGIPEAHRWCQRQVSRKMYELGFMAEGTVIIHNTLTRESEVEPYADLAKVFGWMFVSLVVENRHGKPSIHDVPDKTLRSMLDRFKFQLAPEKET